MIISAQIKETNAKETESTRRKCRKKQKTGQDLLGMDADIPKKRQPNLFQLNRRFLKYFFTLNNP